MTGTSAETRKEKGKVGVACGHAAVAVAGAILVVAGVGMICTLILLPVGIGMAAVGLLAIMWAVDDNVPLREPVAGARTTFPGPRAPMRDWARHQPTSTSG